MNWVRLRLPILAVSPAFCPWQLVAPVLVAAIVRPVSGSLASLPGHVVSSRKEDLEEIIMHFNVRYSRAAA